VYLALGDLWADAHTRTHTQTHSRTRTHTHEEFEEHMDGERDKSWNKDHHDICLLSFNHFFFVCSAILSLYYFFSCSLRLSLCLFVCHCFPLSNVIFDHLIVSLFHCCLLSLYLFLHNAFFLSCPLSLSPLLSGTVSHTLSVCVRISLVFVFLSSFFHSISLSHTHTQTHILFVYLLFSLHHYLYFFARAPLSRSLMIGTRARTVTQTHKRTHAQE